MLQTQKAYDQWSPLHNVRYALEIKYILMSADISRSCIAKNFKTVGHFTNSPLADLFHCVMLKTLR